MNYIFVARETKRITQEGFPQDITDRIILCGMYRVLVYRVVYQALELGNILQRYRRKN